MKKSKRNKTKITATISLAFILVFSAFTTMAIPLFAQDGDDHAIPGGQEGGSIPLPSGVTPDLTLETIAHLSFTPNPVGVDQPILINIWLQPPLHISRYFSGYTVTITPPTGDPVIIGPIDSYRGDTSAWFTWNVNEIGTWTLQFDFPGGYFPPGNYTAVARYGGEDVVYEFEESVYYEPSSVGPYELEVQEDIVYSWPPADLPTDYWERPVSPENREWWPILGDFPWNGRGGSTNWPENTNIYASNYGFTPYVQGPETAHIVWKRLSEAGGLIGGDLGQTSYYTGSGFGAAPNLPDAIVSGRVYQAIEKVVDGELTNVFQCYDLRTGEVYWEHTDVNRIPNYVSHIGGTYIAVPGAGAHMRGMGVTLVYIGSGRLIKYDPWTGDTAVDIPISPLSSSVLYKDPYALGVQNLGGGNYRLINWTIAESERNVIAPFEERIISNISWPFSNLGARQDFEAGVAVSTSGITAEATGVTVNYRLIGADLTTGDILWNITTDTGYGFFSGSTAVADHGKFAVRFNDGYWHAWDLETGQKAWKSELSSFPWGTFGAYAVNSAYGYIYSMAYDGVSAFDWETGKIAWTYNAKTPYAYETPYEGNYPFFSASLVADGKLYAYNSEHTISQPIARGYRLHCINATTGEGIWNITGYMQPGAIADGYVVADNMYDGHLYVFGKGKTETTVTAPDVEIPEGTAVLIRGTVLDMSPAQPDTPAVSKESMTQQMEYLHMQKEIPADVTGVPVTLTAIDTNGDHIIIGTTTTNGYYGTFAYAWTPPDQGTYEIIASFEGDNSYGSSSGATAITVGPAPSPGEPQETEEPTTEAPTTEAPTTEAPTTEAPTTEAPTSEVPTTEQPSGEAPAFPTTEVIIVAAVAVAVVVGVGAYWALRRRK